MGLEVNNLSVGNIQHNFFSNTIQQRFTSAYTIPELKADSVCTKTDLASYLNEKSIKEMVEVSSEIKKILKGLKVTLRINMKVLDGLAQHHLPQTKKITVGIVSHLPEEFRQAVELSSLQKAAVLHDIGKVLIPDHIINKPGSLNEAEREIMESHSDLSYEMLKTTDLDEKTLDLVKNHHHNTQQNVVSNPIRVTDINDQILNVADMYSALRENRSYKQSLSKNQALAIIHEDVKKGNIHPHVFKALVNWANANDNEEASNSAKVKSHWHFLYNKLANSFSA